MLTTYDSGLHAVPFIKGLVNDAFNYHSQALLLLGTILAMVIVGICVSMHDRRNR